jgi:hypothetical protein
MFRKICFILWDKEVIRMSLYRYSQKALSAQAKELGFITNGLEKMLRLINVLQQLNRDPLLKGSLALKGGTAINLTIFNLPRLSHDIDFDYAIPLDLALAYEGEASIINEKLNTRKSIDEIFRDAQRAFNSWSELEPEKRKTATLLKMLTFDFFEVLDSVTIARSRKHIEKYYNMAEIGSFPERMKPVPLRPNLTDLSDAINYNEIYDEIMRLNHAIYIPTDFVFESRREKYVDPDVNINRAGREMGIRRLMSINLLKRLESSVYSFSHTLQRIKKLIDDTIAEIDEFEAGGDADIEMTCQTPMPT